MPYHVIVDVIAGSSSISLCQLDLSKTQVRDLFVLPFVNGASIAIDGKSIQASRIRKLTVTYTDLRSSQALPSIRLGEFELNSSHDSPEILMARRGVDVTSDFPELAQSQATSSVPDMATRVFVVHGRDDYLRRGMNTFLGALRLQPLEWSQVRKATRSASPYVGEILDAAFRLAQAVIVLMTPDDLGMLAPRFHSSSDPAHEREPTGQPRQNVIFEAGMSWQRDRRRTIIVQIGDIRPMSDIGGILIVKLDNTPERRSELAQRLIDAGCPADMTGTDWFQAGDFAIH